MLAEATTAISSGPPDVLAALKRASAETGSDFRYLLDTAMRESSLKPQAKSSTSSATGLFQFVDQTWLGLVKQYGSKYGLSSYAAAIGQSPDGRYHADNQADRQAILALRNDPQISALMEGEFAQATKSTLECSLGRDVCDGELYAAHFLGPAAACKLIRLSDTQPDSNAAAAFPDAASANRNVFYHRDGTPKTVREVHDWALQQTAATPKLASTPPAAHAARAWAQSSNALPVDWSASQLYNSMDAQPFALSPGVVSILASLTPFDVGQDQSH